MTRRGSESRREPGGFRTDVVRFQLRGRAGSPPAFHRYHETILLRASILRHSSFRRRYVWPSVFAELPTGHTSR